MACHLFVFAGGTDDCQFTLFSDAFRLHRPAIAQTRRAYRMAWWLVALAGLALLTARGRAVPLELYSRSLPIPEDLAPTQVRADGTVVYQLEMREANHSFHPSLPDALVWGYNGQYPGPTLHVCPVAVFDGGSCS